MRDYITKLNDRNLQRKKATGITNYVLYSLITLIVFKIFSLIGIINFKNLDIYNLTKLIWLSFCLSLALYWINFCFISSFRNSSSVRILKTSKNNYNYFSNIIISAIFISTIIPAIIMLCIDYKMNRFDYQTIEIILFLLTGLNLVSLVFGLFSKNNDLYEAINKNDDDVFFTKFILLTSLCVIISVIYLLYNLEISDKISLMLLCLLLFAILVISDKIIESHKEDIFSKDLENLEYEIYLKNLSDNDIREVLQKKYMGFLISDWIKSKAQEISIKLEQYEKEKLEIKSKEIEIEKVDKKEYPIEFEGRLKNIQELRNGLNSKKKIFFEDNLEEIKEVLRKDSSIKTEDYTKLKELIAQLSLDKD